MASCFMETDFSDLLIVKSQLSLLTTTNGIKKSSRVGIENKVNYDDKVMELIWKVHARLAAFKTIYLFI